MQQDSPEQIEEQALAWLMRTTSGDFTARQRRRLEQWLARGEQHRRAFEEAKQLWDGLAELRGSAAIAERIAQAPAPSQHTEQFLPPSDDAISAPAGQFARRTRRRWLSVAAAACLALFVVLFNPGPESLQWWLADYHTVTGEQQTLTLADGSIVYLNSASALDYAQDARQRSIELIAGEAEFVVAKDPNRPFVVTAGGQRIKALGTDFIVKKQRGGARITVIESAVQVTQPQWPAVRAVVVHPDEQLNAISGQQPGPVIPVKADRAQAWRHNRLIFESAPLDTVVDEINRYRPGHVFLSNRSLARYRVSGVFNIDQIDKVLAVIDRTLPVKSASLAGRFVLLY